MLTVLGEFGLTKHPGGLAIPRDPPALACTIVRVPLPLLRVMRRWAFLWELERGHMWWFSHVWRGLGSAGPELVGCSPAPPGQGVGAVTGKELSSEKRPGSVDGARGWMWSCERKGRREGDSGNPGVSLNGDDWAGAWPGSCWENRQKGKALYQLAQPVSCCSVPRQDHQTVWFLGRSEVPLSAPSITSGGIKNVAPGNPWGLSG